MIKHSLLGGVREVFPGKPTRRDLLLVIGQLQGIIGRIGSTYADDRSRERSTPIQEAVTEGMDLCVRARSYDPPLTGTWPREPKARK